MFVIYVFVIVYIELQRVMNVKRQKKKNNKKKKQAQARAANNARPTTAEETGEEGQSTAESETPASSSNSSPTTSGSSKGGSSGSLEATGKTKLFEGVPYPAYVVDILNSGEFLLVSQYKKAPDPTFDVCDVQVKIGDLGNACWVDKHFCEDIQVDG